MNRSQSKYFNTASRMDQAFLHILEKKPFEYITVKELCEQAGVNRSTFYLHYETMADLASECLHIAAGELQKKYDAHSRVDHITVQACSLDELNLITPTYLYPYLEFVRENRKLFLAVISHPNVFHAEQYFSDLYRDLFSPIFDRYHFSAWEKKYRLSFYLHGIWAVVEEWLKADCSDAIENIVQLLTSCIYGHASKG